MKNFNFNYSKVKKKEAKLNIFLGLSGEFKFVKRKVIDDSIVEELNFTNLITDNGLDLLFTNISALSFCQLGSGTTTPAVTDVYLNARHIGTNSGKTTATNGGAPDYIRSIIKKFSFSQGSITQPVSEVGVGPSSTGPIVSRTLLKDSNGNPTTLTMQTDEYLDVYYTLKCNPNTSSFAATLNISGVNYTGVVKPLCISSNYYWWIDCSGTSFISFMGFCRLSSVSLPSQISDSVYDGTGLDASASVLSTYVAGDHKLTRTHTFTPSAGAFTTKSISFYSMNHGPAFGFELDSTLSKTASQELTITASLTWGRA